LPQKGIPQNNNNNQITIYSNNKTITLLRNKQQAFMSGLQGTDLQTKMRCVTHLRSSHPPSPL